MFNVFRINARIPDQIVVWMGQNIAIAIIGRQCFPYKFSDGFPHTCLDQPIYQDAGVYTFTLRCQPFESSSRLHRAKHTQ
ncbi:MAG: hypothetical protein A3H25_10960 [Sphingomonadales bacterium RIFCSPLOWO2_12_FULL_63_15]|nr:MAG: hypothetical protein A3H25_10960 [Sphingomonadales bacterium RIFCSPLOWO2_12_FULL_63_15]